MQCIETDLSNIFLDPYIECISSDLLCLSATGLLQKVYLALNLVNYDLGFLSFFPSGKSL